MLQINNLNKSYGNKHILKNLNFNILKNETNVIIGPSGSGKTTLLRSLNYLERVDSGIMHFNKKNIDLGQYNKADISYVRSKSAFVFQNFNLFLNKKVIDNVALGLILNKKLNKQQAYDEAKKALDKVGMKDHLDAYPMSLSGGQQQRVAIARAIALKPDVIFFDEPTSALDPKRVSDVAAIIKDLSANSITMLIVTHEIEFAKKVADKIIFMEDGEIVETGTTEQIFYEAKEIKTRQFLSHIYYANSDYVI